MNTLHDHPSLPIDPDRIFVSLKLADAQRIAKHLEGMTLAKHHEGIPLSEVIDMYAPIVEGIRAAINDGQKTAVNALGLSAIEDDAKRQRAEEAKADGGSLMAEMASQVKRGPMVTSPTDVGAAVRAPAVEILEEEKARNPGPPGSNERARNEEKEMRSGTTSRNTG